MQPQPARDKPYRHRQWQSADGLDLHFRDYSGGADRLPVVCLHGLTRNARDFEGLAATIAGQGRRVLVPEMRGRGRSDYASDPSCYVLPTYLADLEALFAQEAIERFVAIGTSMGGLMTMLMAAHAPERIAAAVINDIGPVVEQEGLDTIKSYVGQGRSFPTWVHAARALAEVHGDTYPDYALEDWLVMAKRTMVLVSNGRIAFDYDMKIAEPIASSSDAAPIDMWPMVRALAGRPVVLVRGELSEILSQKTFAEMGKALPGACTVTVARTGHAPTLEEPAVQDAILAMLNDAQ